MFKFLWDLKALVGNPHPVILLTGLPSNTCLPFMRYTSKNNRILHRSFCLAIRTVLPIAPSRVDGCKSASTHFPGCANTPPSCGWDFWGRALVSSQIKPLLVYGQPRSIGRSTTSSLLSTRNHSNFRSFDLGNTKCHKEWRLYRFIWWQPWWNEKK